MCLPGAFYGREPSATTRIELASFAISQIKRDRHLGSHERSIGSPGIGSDVRWPSPVPGPTGGFRGNSCAFWGVGRVLYTNLGLVVHNSDIDVSRPITMLV